MLSNNLKGVSMKNYFASAVFLLTVLLSAACQGQNQTESSEGAAQAEKKEVSMPEIKVTSPAFEQDSMIPIRYTCEGEDAAPVIIWKDLPEKTKTLALICDDPDAPHGTWVHWVVYDIPASDTSFSAKTPDEKKPFVFGKNSWGKTTYGGPCPPSGTHRYFFKLYALDTNLGLKAGATKEALLKAMEGHVLAQGELMGKYKKQK
jgi:Raf kinase inhibitor-like YbhB/YbcL family protein